MKYAFYPGCSLEVSAGAYDLSVKAVAKVLGMEFVEVDDWNCCGATEYFTQDKLTACSIIARNLALVDKGVDQITAPCAACFLNLRKVDLLMQEHEDLAEQVNEALGAGGLHYEPGSVRVRHLLDVIHTDFGEDGIKAKVKRPLEGLRIAPYYGCQVVRPYARFDDPEYPMRMDELFTWLGAEVVDYSVKSHCCGGHMTQISEPEAFELIRRLLHSAAEYKADVIACMCPMCQLNMDAYQGRVNNHFNTDYNLPVIFFTQLVGLAFGFAPEELGFGKEIVPAEPVLTAKLVGVK
ncbi:MAG: CoB--CoM heterodisulfide reductase iron-sulfur subunit B family protein [Planctomycetota bacterium]